MSRRLILMRHGQTQDNVDQCFATSEHISLTPAGVDQVRSAAQEIKRSYSPGILLSSKLRRAVQSAELIGKAFGMVARQVAGLEERDFGCLQGQPYPQMGELMLADPAYDPAQPWLWAPPGGESLEDVRARAIEALQRMCGPEGREVLVVSHGAVIQAVCAHITGCWEEDFVPANGGVIIIDYEDTLQSNRDCKVSSM